MLPRAPHRRRPRLAPRRDVGLILPELSLGMEILKNLHLAFGEQDAPPAKP